MNVLVIRDDKPGHYHQTEGLLLSLREIYPEMTVEYTECEIRSKMSRSLLKVLLNHCTTFFERSLSLEYIHYFYKSYNLPPNKPDLILSTGGNTANLNVWFAKAYHGKNILNGRVRGLRETLFTKVTTVIDLGYPNQIVIDVAPNSITAEKLKTESHTFLDLHRLQGEFYALLLGGDGAGYRYDDTFYEELIAFLKRISATDDIQWLITTSRRTPRKVEEKLKHHLKDYAAYFVAYNTKPEKILLPFLGASKAVFVTEESASMISEAIAARKPVYTLRSKEANPDRNYQKIVEKFLTKKWIKRIDIHSAKDVEIRLDDFEALSSDSYVQTAKKIKEHL